MLKRPLLLQFCHKQLNLRTLATGFKEPPEKHKEEPVIVVPEIDTIDIIGPPDPVSNLRPIIRKKYEKESELQQKLREFQTSTDAWNQEFWCKHNRNFVKERDGFVKEQMRLKGSEEALTSEEMSVFYKKFLDKYWRRHVDYNLEWYRRNFKLLSMGFRVNLENYIKRMKK